MRGNPASAGFRERGRLTEWPFIRYRVPQNPTGGTILDDRSEAY